MLWRLVAESDTLNHLPAPRLLPSCVLAITYSPERTLQRLIYHPYGLLASFRSAHLPCLRSPLHRLRVHTQASLGNVTMRDDCKYQICYLPLQLRPWFLACVLLVTSMYGMCGEGKRKGDSFAKSPFRVFPSQLHGAWRRGGACVHACQF
jgi:hypothetical protein